MAEKEYIERGALMEEINRIGGHNLCEWETIGVKALVERQPAADVVEVRHGEWIYDENGMDWGLGAWECSLCRCKNDNLPPDSNIKPLRWAGSKYCPNCGAKMDGERKEK